MILQSSDSTAVDLFSPAKLQSYVTENGLDFLKAIAMAVVVYLIGKIVIRVISNTLEKVMSKSKLDITVQSFLKAVIGFTLTLVLWILVISQLGFNPESLLVVLGGASLAVGLALKDNLSNFAGGVMILIMKPFKNGDYIEGAGHSGTVKEIQIFYTVLNTPTNERISVPNGELASSSIKNYSAYDTRRCDLEFGIGYEDDIDKAREVISGLIKADERILADPAPAILLGTLADSSVNFKVRMWVKSSDYWGVHFDMIEKTKKAFDANNISIPFPQRDVHLYKVEK